MAIESGFAFHVHHNVLIEFCTGYQGRVEYIKTNKPASEQELRLRLFKMIPPERLPLALAEAWKAYVEAWKAYNEARKAYAEAWKAYDEAGKACEPELLKLHSELCPNCTFDGKTIFPDKKEERRN